MAKLRTLRPRLPTLRHGVLKSTWLTASTREERERERDASRRAQQPWRAWYHLPIWDHPKTGLRATQLARVPICETCRRVRATVVHHRRMHAGRWALFADPNNLESACKPYHDGAIQRGERAGNYASEIDLDHGISVAANVLYPKELQRSAIAVTLVCGAPASGKSSYVQQHMQPGEIVIDIDAIVAQLAGTALRSNEIKRAFLGQALAERNKRLHALAHERRASRAWFIIGAPSAAERERWAAELGVERVLVIEAPADKCAARIYRDPNRAPIADELAQAVDEWWRRYRRSPSDEIVRG